MLTHEYIRVRDGFEAWAQGVGRSCLVASVEQTPDGIRVGFRAAGYLTGQFSFRSPVEFVIVGPDGIPADADSLARSLRLPLDGGK